VSTGQKARRVLRAEALGGKAMEMVAAGERAGQTTRGACDSPQPQNPRSFAGRERPKASQRQISLHLDTQKKLRVMSGIYFEVR